nr:MAG TPA: hypothetical protein [Caudoviricetes sp.]
MVNFILRDILICIQIKAIYSTIQINIGLNLITGDNIYSLVQNIRKFL